MMAIEVWFLLRMLRILRTKKKSNLKVLRAVGLRSTLMKTIRQWQLDFLSWSRNEKEWLGESVKVERRRA